MLSTSTHPFTSCAFTVHRVIPAKEGSDERADGTLMVQAKWGLAQKLETGGCLLQAAQPHSNGDATAGTKPFPHDAFWAAAADFQLILLSLFDFWQPSLLQRCSWISPAFGSGIVGYQEPIIKTPPPPKTAVVRYSPQ